MAPSLVKSAAYAAACRVLFLQDLIAVSADRFSGHRTCLAFCCLHAGSKGFLSGLGSCAFELQTSDSLNENLVLLDQRVNSLLVRFWRGQLRRICGGARARDETGY